MDSNGSARTSARPKPGESVTLTVVQGDVEHRISSDQVTIERAGGGLPVMIKTRVPAELFLPTILGGGRSLAFVPVRISNSSWAAVGALRKGERGRGR